jgi:hypothetical protein
MTTTINSSGAGAILPILFAIPNTSGDVGSVWFKNASITISNQMAYASAVYDQTGSSRNATQTTASTQPRIVNLGTVDSGIVFDGIDDNISVSDDASLRLNGDHTIMFLSYFNTLGGASAYNNFITKGSVSAGGNGFVMYTGNNSTTFKYARDAQSVTSGNITTGQWQLWAIVCNGTNQQWYLNGVPSGNATNLTFATNTNNGVMYIGANSSSSPCDVTLRLFSVFNRALAQSELVYAYNYLKKVYNL